VGECDRREPVAFHVVTEASCPGGCTIALAWWPCGDQMRHRLHRAQVEMRRLPPISEIRPGTMDAPWGHSAQVLPSESPHSPSGAVLSIVSVPGYRPWGVGCDFASAYPVEKNRRGLRSPVPKGHELTTPAILPASRSIANWVTRRTWYAAERGMRNWIVPCACCITPGTNLSIWARGVRAGFRHPKGASAWSI
jgi:hypothetical protein